MDFDPRNIGYQAGTFIAGIVVTYLGLRKKYATDSTSIHGEATRRELVDTLMEERKTYLDDLRQLRIQQLEDTKKIATLEAENRRLNHDFNNLQQKTLALEHTIDKLRTELRTFKTNTGFDNLN